MPRRSSGANEEAKRAADGKRRGDPTETRRIVDDEQPVGRRTSRIVVQGQPA